MADVQQASLYFFAPLWAAYLTACVSWLVLEWSGHSPWTPGPEPTGNRPWLDILLAVAACAGILGLGQVYRGGWLLPTGSGVAGRLGWVADNLVIYSPIALVLAVRRQGPATVYLSPDRLLRKLAVGAALGVVSVTVFLLLRGEPGRWPGVFAGAASGERLASFLPVFLEGVALAFLLVRLRWACGLWVATAVPAALFAAAHIASHLHAGGSAGEVATFLVLDTVLVAAILRVVLRSRDVVWLGVVHYLMDVAIRAI